MRNSQNGAQMTSHYLYDIEKSTIVRTVKENAK